MLRTFCWQRQADKFRSEAAYQADLHECSVQATFANIQSLCDALKYLNRATRTSGLAQRPHTTRDVPQSIPGWLLRVTLVLRLRRSHGTASEMNRVRNIQLDESKDEVKNECG